MIGFDDEKMRKLDVETKPKIDKAEGIITDISAIEDSASSLDGDDALKLAGNTRDHQFDEQFYRRLRWRIVSRH